MDRISSQLLKEAKKKQAEESLKVQLQREQAKEAAEEEAKK